MIGQKLTRFKIIKLMYEAYKTQNPEIRMTQFIETLRAVEMTEAVKNKMSENLNANITTLKELIAVGHLVKDETVALAHSLGQKDFFNSLTQPADPATPAILDKDALIRCLDMWKSEAKEITSTDKLIKCLLKAQLSMIATDLTYKMDDSDIESFVDADVSRREKILTALFDLILPSVTVILTMFGTIS